MHPFFTCKTLRPLPAPIFAGKDVPPKGSTWLLTKSALPEAREKTGPYAGGEGGNKPTMAPSPLYGQQQSHPFLSISIDEPRKRNVLHLKFSLPRMTCCAHFQYVRIVHVYTPKLHSIEPHITHIVVIYILVHALLSARTFRRFSSKTMTRSPSPRPVLEGELDGQERWLDAPSRHLRTTSSRSPAVGSRIATTAFAPTAGSI